MALKWGQCWEGRSQPLTEVGGSSPWLQPFSPPCLGLQEGADREEMLVGVGGEWGKMVVAAPCIHMAQAAGESMPRGRLGTPQPDLDQGGRPRPSVGSSLCSE